MKTQKEFAVLLVVLAPILGAVFSLASTGSAAAPRLWSISEVADFLGVPVPTLHQWNYLGTGPRSYKVGRHRKYRPEDVMEWLESRASVPAKTG